MDIRKYIHTYTVKKHNTENLLASEASNVRQVDNQCGDTETWENL